MSGRIPGVCLWPSSEHSLILTSAFQSVNYVTFPGIIQQTAFRKNCWCPMPAAASTTALSFHIRLISPSDVRMLQFVQRFTSRDYCTGHESDPKHIKTLLFCKQRKGCLRDAIVSHNCGTVLLPRDMSGGQQARAIVVMLKQRESPA